MMACWALESPLDSKDEEAMTLRHWHGSLEREMTAFDTSRQEREELSTRKASLELITLSQILSWCAP